MQYFIVETDNGWTVAELPADRSAAEVAAESGAAVIDPGPYDSYEEASDALISLQEELDEGDSGDLPRTEAIESQEED
jgi:hypothetical protein